MRSFERSARNILIMIALSCMALPQLCAAGTCTMQDPTGCNYCIMPPYVKRDIKPNVVIMMDNASDMGDPAYCTKSANFSTDHLCTDSYNPNQTYTGYFKPSTKYSYISNRWVPDDGVVSDPNNDNLPGAYSGNLLNWVTTSKYDLLESILVGGISTSRQTNVNTLISKSNTWQKSITYVDSLGNSRTCVFSVNNANVEVTDPAGNGGACGYLDSPANPIPNDPGASVASIRSYEQFAMNPNEQEDYRAAKPVDTMPEASGFWSKVLSAIMDFLVPPAEASNFHISGGSSNLSGGTECTAYSVSISASGGTGSGYTWSISAGSLPPGLGIGASGTPSTTISGTPTTSGTYNFTVQAADDGGDTDTKSYSITIADATVTISPSLTSPLPQGYVGTWYEMWQTASASSVCGNYSWAVSAGSSLPSGISFWSDPSGNLEIYGWPTADGTYTFTLTVTDGRNNTASRSFTLVINPAPSGLAITTGSPLQGGMVGQNYSSYIFTPPYSPGGYPFAWSITSGSLPPGMSFGYYPGDNTFQWSYAYVYGTPTAAGTYTFTVLVVASIGQTASKTFSITILPNPNPVRTTGNLNVQVCTGNYTYNCTTSLPSSSPPTSLADWAAAGCSTSDLTRCILKSGLVDQFWPQARFGVMDFNKSQSSYAVPNVEICIQNCTDLQTTDPQYCSTPSSNFMTAVENAVAIDPVTTLVNGEFEAINYYATAATTTSNNYCNPFTNAQSCVKNFVLILTSGVGADNPTHPDNGLTANVYTSPSYTVPSACTSSALSNLAKDSCYGYNVGDLRPDSDPVLGVPGRQYVTTYIVNTMGTLTSSPTFSYDASNPGVGTTGDILYQAAKYGGGTYYEVQDPALLKADLEKAFQDIIKRAAAGTAASVLASGEGSGANLVQAVFYPRKQFGNDEISWIGRLSNLWYYVDPRFSNSNIREDDGDKVLHLKTDNTHHDYIAQLYFDSSTETTKARRWTDPNGSGNVDPANSLPTDIDFESMGNLWEAGSLLWSRNLTASPRTIYTSPTGTLISFSETNASTLRSSLTASTDPEAQAIIRWVNGWDTPFSFYTPPTDYRHRSVAINGVGPYTWKLGDVLNSTPKISTWMPLGAYHKLFNDSKYGVPGQDPSLQDATDNNHYVTTAKYKGRGMIYAGANDGMLHAFRLGTLQLKWTGMDTTFDKAKLSNNVCSSNSGIDCVVDNDQCSYVIPSAGSCSSTATLGEEVWAFIPKNVLPYLKYTADAGYGSCHIYSVDLTPYIFDASIGDQGSGDVSDIPRQASHWRTILIGGMRYGGASRNIGSTCVGGGTDCVKTPVAGLGYSEYFALDVTDQNNPVLLWEKSAADLPNLGFTTTGPAVVRINSLTGGAPDTTKNGHWFVVLASGPTGSIDTTYNQFLGRSDQPLTLYVLNLKDGSPAGTVTPSPSINNAFVGSMYNATLDTGLNYQDDVIYVPYVKQATDGTWTDGGVGRLATNGSLDPNSWYFSKLIDGIGPVTSAVVKLQNTTTNTLWTFFGTGRYYYERGSTMDDGAGQRQIFGVKDGCFSGSGYHASSSDSCTSSPLSWCGSLLSTSTTTCGVITNVTSTANIPSNPDDPNFKGWYINLDADQVPDASLRAERVITDPLAATSGVVFFTTYKPYSDQCALGGRSYIWAVKYNNGGSAGSLLQGKALVQVSTGSIEQLNLSSAFNDKGDRRSGGLEGVPPTAQGLSILSTPAPVKRILHMRER